ncbi:MAG TPA: hypothetical protein VI248_23275 [Kineosporiaceae bacterium]
MNLVESLLTIPDVACTADRGLVGDVGDHVERHGPGVGEEVRAHGRETGLHLPWCEDGMGVDVPRLNIDSRRSDARST